MPQDGRLFVSAPAVEFSGGLWAECTGRATFDNSSVRVGLRVRQYVHSGGTLIGVKQTNMPKLIDCHYEDLVCNYTLPDRVSIPRFVWELERDQTLEIDVEVRFLMRLEGDSRLAFTRAWLPGSQDKFTFDVPLWSIESRATSLNEDDLLHHETPPPGSHRK